MHLLIDSDGRWRWLDEFVDADSDAWNMIPNLSMTIDWRKDAD